MTNSSKLNEKDPKKLKLAILGLLEKVEVDSSDPMLQKHLKVIYSFLNYLDEENKLVKMKKEFI